MKRKFCCEASRSMYEDYYIQQSGSGMPVFQGSRSQRGHGIGSVLSGLFRSAVPMLKRGLATFGKHALKTGLDIAEDVVSGNKSLKDSARDRIVPTILPGIKRFAEQEIFNTQTGSGKRRRRGKKVKRAKKDIFN